MVGLTYEAMRRPPRRIRESRPASINTSLVSHSRSTIWRDPDQRVNRIDAKEHRQESRMKKLLLDDMTSTSDPQLENYRAARRQETRGRSAAEGSGTWTRRSIAHASVLFAGKRRRSASG